MSLTSCCAWCLGIATEPYRSSASTSFSTPSITRFAPRAMASTLHAPFRVRRTPLLRQLSDAPVAIAGEDDQIGELAERVVLAVRADERVLRKNR